VLARRKKAVAGGALIGVAALIKVLPVVFIAVPCVLRRTGRVVLGFLAAGIVVVGLLAAVAGGTETISAFTRWRSLVSENQSPWAAVENGKGLRYNNQGLAITLARVLGDTEIERDEEEIQLAEWPVRVVWVIYGVIMLAMATAWLACAWRAGRLPEERAWLGLSALTAIGMLAASPLVWTHYFIWLLPGMLYLVSYRKFLIASAILIVAVLIVPHARWLGLHMVYGLVLFVLVAREMLTSAGPAAESAQTS